MTPEGKTKKLISGILLNYKIYPAAKAGAFPDDAVGWYYCPGQSGFGVSGIPDFIGNYRGMFFSVEAKALGKKPTGFQALQIEAIKKAGSVCFVVDGERTLKYFEGWLQVTQYDVDRRR